MMGTHSHAGELKMHEEQRFQVIVSTWSYVNRGDSSTVIKMGDINACGGP